MKKTLLYFAIVIALSTGNVGAQTSVVQSGGDGSIAASSTAIESGKAKDETVEPGKDALLADGKPAAEEILKDVLSAFQRDLDYVPSDSVDNDYVEVMIRHNLAMIEAARIMQSLGEDEGLRLIAENIILARQAELDLLQAWLARIE